jgi:hypothetical protein
MKISLIRSLHIYSGIFQNYPEGTEESDEALDLGADANHLIATSTSFSWSM